MHCLSKSLRKMKSIIYAEVSFEDETKQLFVVLRIYSLVLCCYFVIFYIWALITGYGSYVPCYLPWLFLNLGCLFSTYRCRRRLVFHIYSGFTLLWIIFAILMTGWDCGVQHFMFPLLLMSFFATYENLSGKIIYTAVIFVLRISLFFYTRICTPYAPMTNFTQYGLQILNTSALFIIMFFICWFYSHTNQENQAKLSLYNERLKHDAATDTLTGLPNRRSMYRILESCIHSCPNGFTVAMGDIDFFKSINDTRGHDCGDEVLRRISSYFKDFMNEKGTVCRWGGEEFLFLFPNLNGDLASACIFDLNSQISRLPITCNGETFFITMTFGVEEYDFLSDMPELIRKADAKLYLGKQQGRNQVIY